MDIYNALSSLSANSVAVQATANNIANVNSLGYKSQMVHLESGPLDRGVQVSSIYRDMTPGPAVVYNISEPDVRSANTMAEQGMIDSRENYDTAAAQDVSRMQQADDAASWYASEIRAGRDALSMYKSGVVEGSNTDLPREFANLAVTEYAYSAAAGVIRTQEQMTGALLNIIA